MVDFVTTPQTAKKPSLLGKKAVSEMYACHKSKRVAPICDVNISNK